MTRNEGNIAIRLNASPTMGMGHLYRQLYLGRLLRERGATISYFVPEYSPATALLEDSGFRPHCVAPEAGLPETVRERFDVVIVDLLDTSRDFIETLRSRANTLVDFEDLGEGRHFADVLIDCNLDPERARDLPRAVTPLFGHTYSLLHPDFPEYHLKTKIFSGKPTKVLLTFGGTDPNRLTVRLAEGILEMDETVELTVVIGPGFSDREALDRFQTNHPGVDVRSNITDMAETLWSHQAILCSGGVTLHEALSVGTPPFLINQALHQEIKARRIEQLGAAINLGMANDFDQGKLKRALSSSKGELAALSEAGKKLIDGRGIFRIANEIMQRMRRPETP
ncbi:MAG: hypothetical protein COV67_05140 [Nitrospinae bacterium CG11_big_fil_rev_8_21_14_0_20_56_8]|nr:MAG: hypothetical protein COV67_05140 [Nitrospinae bacterium CG11_big_fil_rev_8_21_14_0_20_56_8]